jgi:hypothetical protein
MVRIARGIALVLLVVTTAVAAQEQMMWRGGWGRRFPPRFPTAESFDGRFNFCRLMFTSQYREPSGSGWNTDYPGADLNFPIRLGELTKARISRQPTGESNHLVVKATDPFLYQCPFLLASDIGTVRFEPEETVALRAYFEKGGFLWVDDFWGEEAWRRWEDQLRRILPEYEIRDLAPDHPLFGSFYTLRRVPQIPSIQSWYDTGGMRQERGFEPGDPHLRAVIDEHDRILVLMTHNTDIADGWEREEDNEDFFYAFTAEAYGVGINVAIWMLTH